MSCGEETDGHGFNKDRFFGFGGKGGGTSLNLLRRLSFKQVELMPLDCTRGLALTFNLLSSAEFVPLLKYSSALDGEGIIPSMNPVSTYLVPS